MISSKRSPSPGSFAPPIPAFATSASSGSVNAAKTCVAVADVDRRGSSRPSDVRARSSRSSSVRRAPSAARRSAIASPIPFAGSGDDDVLPLETIHAGESTSAARAAPIVQRARRGRTSPPRPCRPRARPRARCACRSARAPSPRGAARSASRCTGHPERRTTRRLRADVARDPQRDQCVDRRVDERREEPGERHPAERDDPRRGIARIHSDAISSVNAAAPSVSASTLRTTAIDTNAPTSAAAADRAEEPAQDPRVRVVARHDQHRQRGEEEHPADVDHRERRRPEPQELVARDEPNAVEHPGGRPVGYDLRQPHERRDEQERREVGRRVDVQDVRGADQADQDARQRRPEEDRERGSPPGTAPPPVRPPPAPRRRAPARPRAAPRSTARGRRPTRRRGRAARRRGARPRACSSGDRGEQRHAREVAREHRPPRADAAGDRAAPEAEQRDGEDLGDDHPRHPLRRVRVVRSTNHGSASHVICVPVDEIISATSSAASRRSRSRLTARRRRRS